MSCQPREGFMVFLKCVTGDVFSFQYRSPSRAGGAGLGATPRTRLPLQMAELIKTYLLKIDYNACCVLCSYIFINKVLQLAG